MKLENLKPLSQVFDLPEISAEALAMGQRDHWHGMLALLVAVKGIALVALWHATLLFKLI